MIAKTKKQLLTEMLNNAGVDPVRILDGGGVTSEKSVEEGTVDFKFYHAAKAAEDRFEAALKKRYGKAYQDKRYTAAKFDSATQAAYDAFVKAGDAWRKEVQRSRSESG